MKKNKIVNKIGILVLAVMLSILSSFNRLCGRYCYRCGLSYLPWSKQGV